MPKRKEKEREKCFFSSHPGEKRPERERKTRGTFAACDPNSIRALLGIIRLSENLPLLVLLTNNLALSMLGHVSLFFARI